MSQEKKDFYERYAPYAMEQQRKYGIPASVTLSQMCIESGIGKSQLATQDNNYFGIKASSRWIAEGKPYGIYDDDRKNEKFCHFNSVEDSIEYHSLLLKGSRYSLCQKYSPTDYTNWVIGIKRCGYASDPNYVKTLTSEIKAYNLSKYDQMAANPNYVINIGFHQQQDRQENVLADNQVTPTRYTDDGKKILPLVEGNFALPVATTGSLIMTSGFGPRSAPTKGASSNHKGIDISVNKATILATEDNGKVVDTGNNAKAGKYVTVEYSRSDGHDYRVSYCHLSQIDVNKGDTVNHGWALGISGNTGISTGPHLHLTVRQKNDNGEFEHIDPLDYIAELSVRGNLQSVIKTRSGSEDLLASRKEQLSLPQPTLDKPNDIKQTFDPNDPKNMLVNLLAQSGMGTGGGGDLLSGFVSLLFTMSMAFTAKIKSIDDQAAERMAQIKESQSVKTEDEKTIIMRSRESVDATKAIQLAAINFDNENPEISQGNANNYRLS